MLWQVGRNKVQEPRSEERPRHVEVAVEQEIPDAAVVQRCGGFAGAPAGWLVLEVEDARAVAAREGFANSAVCPQRRISAQPQRQRFTRVPGQRFDPSISRYVGP